MTDRRWLVFWFWAGYTVVGLQLLGESFSATTSPTGRSRSTARSASARRWPK